MLTDLIRTDFMSKDRVDFCVNRFDKNRFYVKKSGGFLAPPGALYAVVRA